MYAGYKYWLMDWMNEYHLSTFTLTKTFAGPPVTYKEIAFSYKKDA